MEQSRKKKDVISGREKGLAVQSAYEFMEEINKTKPKGCDIIKDRVDAYLEGYCKGKYNKLGKCSDCELSPEEQNLPLINSPSDAFKLNSAANGTGGIKAAGTLDNFWEVGLGSPNAPNSVGNWIPAFVTGNPLPGTWENSPFVNADWISFWNDTAHPAGAGNTDAYFRIRFILNSNINPADFALHLDFFADNSVQGFYVNGIAQNAKIGYVPPSNGYGFRGFEDPNQAKVVLKHDWQTCLNEIIVHVQSGPGYMGFLAQNSSFCFEADLPKAKPDISVKWGDSDCDCMETDDFEVLCICACNPYSNLSFEDLTINYIEVVDENGNPVPPLPDGSPSVEILPIGPICFGTLGPCNDHRPNCKSRQIVLRTRGAKDGKYSLKMGSICYRISISNSIKDCFNFNLCKD